MSRGDRKLGAVLERAVLDEFGVNATIARVVDVFMQEAVSVGVSELPGHIASRRLDKDIDSNCGSNAGSSGESPLQEHHFATRLEV